MLYMLVDFVGVIEIIIRIGSRMEFGASCRYCGFMKGFCLWQSKRHLEECVNVIGFKGVIIMLNIHTPYVCMTIFLEFQAVVTVICS